MLARLLCAGALLIAGCARTCPASNVSYVTSEGVPRVGLPGGHALARSAEELSAIFTRGPKTPAREEILTAFLATDFTQFDVAVVDVGEDIAFLGLLRNSGHYQVKPYFDGERDASLVAVLAPPCPPIDHPSCGHGAQLKEQLAARSVVFRIPKGKTLRVERCVKDCPTRCPDHS